MTAPATPPAVSDARAETSVVMPEDVWFKLCAQQCKARRKQYGGTRAECLDEYACGICDECASDAIAKAPTKYRTTKAVADGYDRLPGLSHE